MKKKILSAALAVTMAAALTACGGGSQPAATTAAAAAPAAAEAPKAEAPKAEAAQAAPAADAINIVMATGGQDTLPSYAAAIDVINDIMAADSSVNIEYHGARELGDDAAIVQQVMNGTIQIGGTGASALSTYTNLMDGFTIPFLINSYEKERVAMVSPEAQAIFDKVEEELGIKILASYDSGMRHLANNTRPINTVADMKGIKMRVVPTDCLIDSFTALGASPTNLAYGEIYTGLQNKVIDGEEINITSIYSEKHYEVLKYFTEVGLYPFETTIICNAEWFHSLPENVQAELEDGFRKGYDYVFDKYIKDAEEAGYKAMEEAGIEVVKIDDPSEFQAAVADVAEKYRTSDPLITAFVDMVNGL